jgi:hypothetical protein
LPSDLPQQAGLPSTPAPRAVYDEPQRSEPERSDRSRSRLLPLLLALALLLGGGYLLKNLLSGDDDTGTVTAPVRRSPAASTAASAAPSPNTTYSSAQLAASLKDPHFRHGYEYGKKRAAAGPVADAEAACRTQALKERAAGYPWGAHDRQGCLVGATA